jgi:hypothetical protein
MSKVYESLASRLNASANCAKSGNTEWQGKHEEAIERIVNNFMPSGSGIDSGVKLDRERSNDSRLVFTFGYHHMAESGMYDGWTEHTLTVTPSFIGGFEMKLSGRDRNGVKEYLYDTFHAALSSEIA